MKKRKMFDALGGVLIICVAVSLFFAPNRSKAEEDVEQEPFMDAIDELERVATAAEKQGYELSGLGAERLYPVCYADAEGNEIHYYYYH